MPKITYKDSDPVQAEPFERYLSIPVDADTIQRMQVGDEVTLTVKAEVSEVSERQEMTMYMEREEGSEKEETVRRLGVNMTSVEIYKRGDNEYEDMAED